MIRCVDFGPGYACDMHRTQSLDYGIVLEGEVDMVLDSGEVNHAQAWRRRRPARDTAPVGELARATEWCRMMFVLQDCKPLFVEGEEMKEDIVDIGIPPSGN